MGPDVVLAEGEESEPCTDDEDGLDKNYVSLVPTHGLKFRLFSHSRLKLIKLAL